MVGKKILGSRVDQTGFIRSFIHSFVHSSARAQHFCRFLVFPKKTNLCCRRRRRRKNSFSSQFPFSAETTLIVICCSDQAGDIEVEIGGREGGEKLEKQIRQKREMRVEKEGRGVSSPLLHRKLSTPPPLPSLPQVQN